MNWFLNNFPWKWLRLAVAAGMLVVSGVTYPRWWPPLSTWIDTILTSYRNAASGNAEHAEHGDKIPAATASSVLDLTPQAIKNLGLTPDQLRPIELGTYQRTINVPAVLAALPGRTKIQVASPLNGIIMHVHAVTSETVVPGELLFDIRLTYEDLVETQSLYLKTIGELEVENREITRLESVTQSGAISGKVLLERRYAKEKLEAVIRSQRQALKLHGLSDRQVDEIANEGKLLRDLQIVAPDIDRHGPDEKQELRLSGRPVRPVSYVINHSAPAELLTKKPLVIEDLSVHKGQAVNAGEHLCSLSDFSRLFIEGKAFEVDANAIAKVAEIGWTVEAVFPDGDHERIVRGLSLAFIDNSVDPVARTLSFFVELPNEILNDKTNSEKQRFVSWRYRPGQRLEVRVPVEEWKDEIVLPVDAVVKDGADWFVFRQNGKRFERIPVHVRHRDQRAVVIENDGTLYLGDIVAMKSAHQLQMALKNKSGGAVDPHAGHSH